MRLVDTHLHTRFSTDSRMTLQEALSVAQVKNIAITVTEHMDLLYPVPHKFYFDIDDYLKTYAPYRNDSCFLGIELGMRSECLSENRRIACEYNFDYVLGSVHLVNGEDVFQDIFYGNSSKQEKYCEYLAAMLKCVEQHDFVDCMSHIDYVARYAPYEDPEFYYNEFADEIDAVLRVLVEREQALEINTRRLADAQVAKNILPIYKRFKELGGCYATLGSDAHSSSGVGQHFALGTSIARESNLQIVYFKERKRKICQ